MLRFELPELQHGQPYEVGAAKDATSFQSLKNQEDTMRPVFPGAISNAPSMTFSDPHDQLENPPKKARVSGCFEDKDTDVMKQMPSVTATGDGPYGRTIDGYLYRYTESEVIIVVCVCHGYFFTPAEFVEHAGGKNVTDPLKHIKVSRDG